MGLISIISKGIKAMYDEATTPKSHRIGQHFEDYVRNYIFTDEHFDLVEKTHDYNTNRNDYVESSLKPDFKFRDRKTGMEFYVEAKFRTSLHDGKIVWCNDKQLYRYQQYNKETPVFLIIGMGSSAKNPDYLALLPLSAAKYTGLFPSYADEYEIKVDKAMRSKKLWREYNYGL